MNRFQNILFFSILIFIISGDLRCGLATTRVPLQKAVCKRKIPEEQKAPPMKPIEPVTVIKRTLSNGMTILIVPNHAIPMVYLQIWYNVGSKDEQEGEKGIAHLIEHMIFKGTEQLLSESDINVLVHKLSGSTNAFTSYDFTGYRFDMPTHHWKKILPIIADCMRNASFQDEHLNSEMKAVIQELKMGRDNFIRALVMQMLASIFSDHPYHYPVIGYKQDLWSVTGADLKKFYHHHYIPNNATFVIIGDVNPDEVVAESERYFGSIQADLGYQKETFVHTADIAQSVVTLYRDVQQPQQVLAWLVPGSNAKQDHILDIAALILGAGKASRLYRILVDETKLATSLTAFPFKLFEHSLFIIAFEPTKLEYSQNIIDIIHKEIADVINNGFQPGELTRAVTNARMQYYALLEDMQQQAYLLGKYYLATGDEQYIFQYLNQPSQTLEPRVRQLLQTYIRPTIMHTGMVLPIPESEKKYWLQLQEESDAVDERILNARVRKTEVEAARYALQISAEDPGTFDYPNPHLYTTKNGIKVLYYNNTTTPKIAVGLRLKAQSYFEPTDKPGLYQFIANMITEGTEKHSAIAFAQELELRGISLMASPGLITINMLNDDLARGLSYLHEVVSMATFPLQEVEKIRSQMIAEVKNFWDDSQSLSTQLLKEMVYKDHPYAKRTMGTLESIAAITRKDLQEWYKKFYSPDQAVLVIIGDIRGIDIPAVVEEALGSWSGPVVADISYPTISPRKAAESEYPMNRDQVVLSYGQLSVPRTHPDYDALWIFDQILGGGALGSLSSRLFQLREQTGLFYSIGGSLVAGANEEPGMVRIKTMVSLDRLAQAHEMIIKTLQDMVDSITPEELEQAKRAIINSFVHYFDSNAHIAQAFLFLERFHFPYDYFDVKAKDLARITIEQVKQAVKKILQVDTLCVLKVGRIGTGKDSKSK